MEIYNRNNYRGDGTKGSPVTRDGVLYSGSLLDSKNAIFHLLNGLIHREDGPAYIAPDGALAWWVNGILQRLDGPARILADGTQEWWVNDVLHRLDGPAAIWADGSKEWRVNGKLHRLDGPARIWTDERLEWYVEGQEIDIVDVLGYEPAVPLTEGEQMIVRLSV